MANITLLRSPGRESVEKRIIKLVHSDLIFYLHKEDDCLYFIVSDMLYGYKQLKLSPVRLSPTVNIFWKDDCIFKVEDGKLIKDPTTDFEIIETYHELIELYDNLRLI